MRLILLTAITALAFLCQPAHGDPTRPPTQAEISAWQSGRTVEDTGADWQLQTVLISEARRVAVINGQRYRTDDRIGSARIIAIDPGRVTLERDGEQFSLTIASRTQGVRRTPN